MILADILGSLFGVLCIVLTWLWLRRVYQEIKRARLHKGPRT
jgi:flagellar biogenesis protein FliO